MNFCKQALMLARLQRGAAVRSAFFVQTPARFVHARGYNDFYDGKGKVFHETNFALMNAKETPQFTYIINKYGYQMTDVQLSYILSFMGRQNLDKDKSFWEVIFPAVKKQIATLDRNCTRSLFHFIEGASLLKIQDNEFWELVEQKLVDERLHRYFALDKLTEVLVLLAEVGRGSDELIDVVEKTLIKHRLAITPEIADSAREGFRLINKGSEILFKVLDDPTVELPALE